MFSLNQPWTIQIKEVHVSEDRFVWEGTVKELPDLADYADTWLECANLLLESINMTVNLLNNGLVEND